MKDVWVSLKRSLSAPLQRNCSLTYTREELLSFLISKETLNKEVGNGLGGRGGEETGKGHKKNTAVSFKEGSEVLRKGLLPRLGGLDAQSPPVPERQ